MQLSSPEHLSYVMCIIEFETSRRNITTPLECNTLREERVPGSEIIQLVRGGKRKFQLNKTADQKPSQKLHLKAKHASG